ncbi:MAG TPA: acyl-CoA thioesterase [Steroidobacteraceae bacterium]|nr:acyl-CoA thioesterase [Steroidobacteraceae bacterium]
MSTNRPDPTRLKLEPYPFRLQMQSRFGDLDIRGHINNVSIVQYTEDARVAFQMETVGREIYIADSPVRVVVAQMTLHFVSEGFFPAPIDAGVGIARIGNSSYLLTCGLFQEGKCIAVQDTSMVYMGSEGPMPLTAQIRERMSPYLIK